MKKRKLGKTNLKLSAIGFGGAPIGNLFKKLNDETCNRILEKSFKSKINIYDTSPFYGYGLSEHRLGNYLKNINNNNFYLSTKVGRYLMPEDSDKINRGVFAGGLNFKPKVDYSYDGTMRSFEQSLNRLAATNIDICLIHDVDKFTFGNDYKYYFKKAMKGAYKAIHKLKDEKVIKAVGVGINDSDVCSQFVNEGDFDCVLLAGRYTLLDQSALNDLFPVAKKNNVGIILAGIFNSGILAKGLGNKAKYFYKSVPDKIRKKYINIKKFCNKYKIPVPAAAIQFCYLNSKVTSLILGMDDPKQIKQNMDYLKYPIPKDFWIDLINSNLIDERCPII